MFEHAERRRRLEERMEAVGVDVLFLAPSSDLEYLTGLERQIPTFGQSQQANEWVNGAFLRRGGDPVFAVFEVGDELPGELVVVDERDDGFAPDRGGAGLGERFTHRMGATASAWGRFICEREWRLRCGQMAASSDPPVSVASGVSTSELARALDVTVSDVIKALMTFGHMKATAQPLTDDEVELVALLLHRNVTVRPAPPANS